MGVDTSIFVKKEQAKDLVCDNFFDFVFLAEKTFWRWAHFEELFHLDEVDDIGGFFVDENHIFTNTELLMLLAENPKIKVEDRGRWTNILGQFSLLFLPDTQEEQVDSKEWVSLYDIYSKGKEKFCAVVKK